METLWNSFIDSQMLIMLVLEKSSALRVPADPAYPLFPNLNQEMTVLKAGKQFYKNTVPTPGE